jgi:hypothetical protein
VFSVAQISAILLAHHSISVQPRAMAQAPYIRCYLVGRKLRPAHWRHEAAILFWLRHALSYRFRDSGVATITPQPFLAG